TGDVKTAPAQAASSIPTPTKPPWSGSWPEPPPETRPTLPATGASRRITSWLARSTRTRAGWAAATPSSASGTTFSGSLMNFLTTFAATLMAVSLLSFEQRIAANSRPRLDGGRLRSRDVRDRAQLDAGRRDHVVRKDAEQPTCNVGSPVHPHLAPVRVQPGKLRRQQRSRVPGRVDGGTGLRPDGDDDPDHDQADDQTGEQLRSSALVHDADDREHQNGCSEALVQHRRPDARGRRVADMPD